MNYLDLQDINLLVAFSVSISPHGTPVGAKITLNNNILFDDTLNNKFVYVSELPLLDPVNISIEMYDKNDNIDNTSAIVIDYLKFDDFNLIPTYTGHAVYTNNRNFKGPTYHLGFNGVWSLNIPEPFYRWHHRITGQGWLLEPVK